MSIVRPLKSTQKKVAAKPKKPVMHPKYSEMVTAAITSLKERGGSSRQAILKYIMANFKVGTDAKPVNAHLKMALKAGVKNNSLKQSKGTGATGSFRIGEVKKAVKPKTKKPAAKKAVKPKAAKPKKTPKKKTAPKKPAGEKKVAAKPKTKKPATKKAAKPATKKTAKSPAKTKPAAKPKAKKTPKKK